MRKVFFKSGTKRRETWQRLRWGNALKISKKELRGGHRPPANKKRETVILKGIRQQR